MNEVVRCYNSLLDLKILVWHTPSYTLVGFWLIRTPFLYYYINSPFLHLSFIISGVSVCSTLATLQNAMHQIKTYRLSLHNHTNYTSILIHNCFYFLTYSISDYRCMPYLLYCRAHQQQSADRLTIIKQLTYYEQQQSTINGRLIDVITG